jgi:hypothetical protein
MWFEDILMLMILASGVFLIGIPTFKFLHSITPKKRNNLAEAKIRLEQARVDLEAARLNKEAEKLYEKMYDEALQDEQNEEQKQENRR